MASYYLAPSLVQLRAEVNAAWPGRDKASDGWVGDTSHAARPSDHNPDWADGGVVRALDIDKDGINAGALIAALLADSRTNYVIHRRVIYQRIHGFRPRTYTGANAHLSHVHLSIRHGRTWENSRTPWLTSLTSNTTPGGGNLPTVPVGTLPNPIPEVPDMTPAELRATLLALFSEAAAGSTPQGRDFRNAVTSVITPSVWANPVAQGIAAAVAQPATVDVQALANALAPILNERPSLTQGDIDTLADAVADRLAIRLAN